MEKEAHVLVGSILKPHALKGALKVRCYAESPAVFEAKRSLLAADRSGRSRSVTVRWMKPGHRSLLLALEGVEDRSQAEALVGWDLYADKSAFPPAEEDSFYWFELIGLEVRTGDGRRLGRVEQIFPTGSHDVFVVRDGPRETLVPAVAEVVVEVDLEHGVLRVDLPEGLEPAE